MICVSTEKRRKTMPAAHSHATHTGSIGFSTGGAKKMMASHSWRLMTVSSHFHRPEQMRKRELAQLPLAFFFNVYLSHHERVGHLMAANNCRQIYVVEQDAVFPRIRTSVA